MVNWSESDESNINYYEVEYSVNGKYFSSQKIVYAGNPARLGKYQAEILLRSSPHHFFIIKIMHKSGSVEYSSISELRLNLVPDSFTIQINPAKTYTNLSLSNREDANTLIELVNNNS